jgi:hypothetical protein
MNLVINIVSGQYRNIIVADSIKNFLDELDKFVPAKNKHSVIESRASHIIASAVNLVHLIKESYSEEEANDLVKRLYRSIMTEDEKKFSRKIKELKAKK